MEIFQLEVQIYVAHPCFDNFLEICIIYFLFENNQVQYISLQKSIIMYFYKVKLIIHAVVDTYEPRGNR